MLTEYSGWEAIRRASCLLISKKILTPMLKLLVCRKLPFFCRQYCFISSRWVFQPVEPETTGTPKSRHFLTLSYALSGPVNSIATSAREVFSRVNSSVLSILIRKTISCFLSRAISSIIFPILPYPIRAILINQLFEGQDEANAVGAGKPAVAKIYLKG